MCDKTKNQVLLPFLFPFYYGAKSRNYIHLYMQFLRLLAAISDKFIWDTYIQMKQFHGLAGADLGGGAEGEGEGSF